MSGLWSWYILNLCFVFFFFHFCIIFHWRWDGATDWGSSETFSDPKINGPALLLPQHLVQQTLHSITLSSPALGPLKVHLPSSQPAHTNEVTCAWKALVEWFCLVSHAWKQASQSRPQYVTRKKSHVWTIVKGYVCSLFFLVSTSSMCKIFSNWAQVNIGLSTITNSCTENHSKPCMSNL